MAGTLVVPIDVAALAVGRPDTQGAGSQGVAENLAPTADFSRLPWVGGGAVHNPGPYLSAVALENGEAFEGQVPLLEGIHVHWALPDGLTTGTARTAGLDFPSAPNRWLVTRLAVTAPPAGPATTALRSWVVESDRLSASATAPPGLQQPTVAQALDGGGQTFAYIGQAFDLDGWTEQGASVPRLAPFTALGYGEPTFAAFYPNSSTVFGHFDPLTDLGAFDPSTTAISYHVAGWYSDPATDPLVQPHATPASYDWACPQGAAPTTTVCTGLVDAIAWDPGKAYLDQVPGTLTVAIGASLQEAVSSLMADALDTTDRTRFAGAEQLLNALQFGVLSGASNAPGSLAQFEEDVHGAGFATLPGGPLWTVATASGGSPDEVTLPDQQAEALNALNVTQLQLNDAQLTLTALRGRLFADWHKYELVQHAPGLVPQALRGQGPQVQAHLAGQVAAIGDALREVAELTAGVQDAARALSATLDRSLTLTDQIGAPRYYQPADPALVLSGPDVTPTERYGNDGAGSPDGTLPCRLDSQLVTALDVRAGLVPGSAAATVGAAALPALAAQPAAAPAALLQALVAEALLLAPGLQPAVAAALAAQGGPANPAVLDFGRTVSALETAARQWPTGTASTTVTYAGGPPQPLYVTAWNGSPWLPLLLQYDVQLEPVAPLDPASGPASYDPHLLTSGFDFDPDSIDLEYAGPAPGAPQAYTGTVILTPGATVDLRAEIAAYLQALGDDDPELAAIKDALAGVPLLSQALTGFTDALRMRAATLQMPVGDPLLPPPLQPFAAGVAQAVAGENAAAPLPENAFNPIRAGSFAINRLRLVDVFGRFRDYPAPRVLVSRGVTGPDRLQLPAGTAFLPPRITQPARLLFRWRAADDLDVESNASPAASPVLGWVVPGQLDTSLQLYAPAGTPLGQLALSADATRVLWTPAPGGPWSLTTPLATVLQGVGDDLAAFAEALYGGGDATFFAPFAAAVRDALALALPERFRETASQAVLLGRPLALARAALSLDVAGGPATDESWTTFAAAVLDGGAPGDGGLGAVEFPVRLGALEQLEDTLVGYWIAPADAAGYRSFWCPSATAAQGGVAPPAPDTLTLTATGSSAAARDVVLLLDPRGCVHATTGVLPVKQIDIPTAQYAQALASLAVAFPTAPVLSGTNSTAEGSAPPPMTIVQPKVATGAWSWITTDGTVWAGTALTGAATSQATLDFTPQRIAEGWLSLTGLSDGS